MSAHIDSRPTSPGAPSPPVPPPSSNGNSSGDDNDGGVIINMGSTSWMVGQGGMAAYTAAKSGVVGLTRSFARDLGEFNIRVNSVVPGWVMTQRQIDLWLNEESEKELMRRQCLKEKLMPAEIAQAVLFFSSEQSSGCTNQSYVVDKGWL